MKTISRPRHGHGGCAKAGVCLFVLCVLGICNSGTASAADAVTESTLESCTLEDLQRGIENNDLEFVVHCLKSKPELAIQPDAYQTRPLYQALARGGNFAIVQALVAHGADVRKSLPDGDSLLYLAMRAQADPRTVNFLIEKEADVRLVTEKGETMLHWAANSGNAQTIEGLVAAGWDPGANKR